MIMTVFTAWEKVKKLEKLEKAMKRLEEQIKFAELIKLDSISVFTSDANTIIEALKKLLKNKT